MLILLFANLVVWLHFFSFPQEGLFYTLAEKGAGGGYLGAAKALLEMTPQGIIEEMKKSGLRGRGGAGFSTGMKWEFAAKPKADRKYFLCNADEGDPGAFMNRSVMEGNPHSVLEGLMIAARAIGI